MTDVSNEWQIKFKNTVLIECFKRLDGRSYLVREFHTSAICQPKVQVVSIF